MIIYTVQLVGGPYDGAPGLKWVDDGKHEPPEEIHIATCRGRGECGMLPCAGAQHVAYWTPEELATTPARAVPYAREVAFVADHAADSGVARYTVGGLDMFGRLETADSAPGLVTADGGFTIVEFPSRFYGVEAVVDRG